MDRFRAYAGAGAVGTAVHYAVLLLLSEMASGTQSPTWAVYASSVGAVLGAATNYFLNHRFVFASAHRHRRTAPRFVAVAMLGVLINGAVVGVLTSVRVPILPAQLVATATVLAGGYLFNRHWTFS
ncbi:MAG: GtrA family protein [Sinimarinibacterium sp.]